MAGILKNRSGLYSVPKSLAPVVQMRMLPQRLIDPILVRPALKKAREAWG